MPDINITIKLDADHAEQHASTSDTIAATGSNYDGGTVATSTTAAILSIKASVATLGRAYFANTSSTAAEIIEIGRDVAGTFYPLIRVRPSEPPACFDLVPGITY